MPYLSDSAVVVQEETYLITWPSQRWLWWSVCVWLRYTWWHNEHRLDLNEEYIRPLSHGHIEITLESSLAEGTYQCEASNQYGTVRLAIGYCTSLRLSVSLSVCLSVCLSVQCWHLFVLKRLYSTFRKDFYTIHRPGYHSSFMPVQNFSRIPKLNGKNCTLAVYIGNGRR